MISGRIGLLAYWLWIAGIVANLAAAFAVGWPAVASLYVWLLLPLVIGWLGQQRARWKNEA